MKRLKRLTAVLAGSALLAGVMPLAAQAAHGPAFSHYVACGVSENAKPAHLCQKPRKKGAFFRSNHATVYYTVCVKFPIEKKPLCAGAQKAKQGTLYVNRIKSNVVGVHRVTWFVEGKKVGSFVFRVPN